MKFGIQEVTMRDADAITTAKTEYREGYNSADPDRVLSVFGDYFTDFSTGQPSFFGGDSRSALRSRLQDIFARFSVRMTLTIIGVEVFGDQAYEQGWQNLWLTPRSGGPEFVVRMRYMELWTKQSDGSWKITFMMTNKDEKPEMAPY